MLLPLAPCARLALADGPCEHHTPHRSGNLLSRLPHTTAVCAVVPQILVFPCIETTALQWRGRVVNCKIAGDSRHGHGTIARLLIGGLKVRILLGELTDQIRNFGTHQLTETAGRTSSQPLSLLLVFLGVWRSLSRLPKSRVRRDTFGVQAETGGLRLDPERLATKLSASLRESPQRVNSTVPLGPRVGFELEWYSPQAVSHRRREWVLQAGCVPEARTHGRVPRNQLGASDRGASRPTRFRRAVSRDRLLHGSDALDWVLSASLR